MNKPTLTAPSVDRPVDNWSWFSTLEEDEVKTKEQPRQSDFSVGLENEGWSDKEQPKKTQGKTKDNSQVHAWGLITDGVIHLDEIFSTREAARNSKNDWDMYSSDRINPVKTSVRKLLITVL